MKPEKLKHLLRCSMRDNPRASEKEIHDICLQRCIEDPDLKLELFEYWFANSYRDFITVEFEPGSNAVLASPRAAKFRRDERSTQSAMIDEVKRRIRARLMDFELSDGTQLRNATFGQCASEGGWLLSLSRAGKRNEIVGKKLTEKDLQALRQRSFDNKSKAA